MSASRRDVLLAGTAAAVAGHAWAQSIGSVGPSGTVGPVIGPTAGGGVSIPAVAGDPLVGGASFGLHNNFYLTSNEAASTESLATTIGAGGSSGVYLALTLPAPSGTAGAAMNIPANTSSSSGDYWYFLRTKTAASDTNTSGSSIFQTLLGVTGGNETSASPGGGVSMQSLQTFQGAVGTGWAVNPTLAGQLYARRQASGAWQWLSQSTLGLVPINVVPSTVYGVCAGLQYQASGTLGAGTYGNLTVATLTAPAGTPGTPQTALSTSALVGNTRPTTSQLFNIIGGNGAPAAVASGCWTGEASDLWIIKGVQFPTATQIQQMTDGIVTVLSVVIANGGSAANIYHNSLDVTTQVSGVIPADTKYTSLSTAGVTINNFTGASLVTAPCGPHRFQVSSTQQAILSLTRKGPFYVWPRKHGATTGAVWFEGVGFPGAQVEANLTYLDTSTSGWTTIGTIPGSGAFAFALTGMPNKKNFFRNIGIVGDTSTRIFETDIHAVGVVKFHLSQSEGVILEGSSTTSSGAIATATGSSSGSALSVSGVSGTPAVGNFLVGSAVIPGTIVKTVVTAGSAYTIYPPQNIPASTALTFQTFTDTSNSGHSITPPNLGVPQTVSQPFASTLELSSPSTTGYNYFLSRGIQPHLTLMVGGGNPGDGNMLMVQGILQDGESVMLVNLRHSGATKDVYTWCNYLWTLPTPPAFSSLVATATLSVTTAMVQARAALQGLPGASYVVVTGTWRSQVKEGTVTVTLSDGTIITDNNAASGGTPYAVGGLQVTTAGSPGGGATLNTAIASSYVNYVTASNPAEVQITLAANPNNATITSITYKAKQEIVDTSSTQKTTQINGFGAYEAHDLKCQFVAPYGRTYDVGDWISSELAEAGASVQAMAGDQTCKWEIIRQYLAAYCYAGVDAGLSSPNMLLCPKGRDTAYTAGTIGPADIGRAAQQAMWAGGTYGQTYFFPMPWCFDGSLEAASDPHPGWDNNGGRRLAERWGWAMTAFSAGTPIPTFSWGTPIFGTGLNGYTTAQVAIPIIDNSTGLPINASTYSIVADLPNSGAFGTGVTDWWWTTTPASSSAGTNVDNANYFLSADSQHMIITKNVGVWLTTETFRYAVGSPGPNTTTSGYTPGYQPYFNNVYITGGIIPAANYAVGLLMPPLFYNSDVYP